MNGPVRTKRKMTKKQGRGVETPARNSEHLTVSEVVSPAKIALDG